MFNYKKTITQTLYYKENTHIFALLNKQTDLRKLLWKESLD